MQPQRETITDNLTDVIQIIHLGGRSGTLTVERGEGELLEVGSITFISGRVVDARVAHRAGPQAFNYLNVWRTCRFSFTDHPASTQQTQPVQVSHFSRYDSTYGNTPPPRSRQTEPIPSRQLVPSTGLRSSFPRRTQAGEELAIHPEMAQLPRLHRRLLLLINGQRSSYELARLMARDLPEVQELLDALGRAGFIQS